MQPELDPECCEADGTHDDFMAHVDGAGADITRVGNVEIATTTYAGRENTLVAEYDHDHQRLYLYLI